MGDRANLYIVPDGDPDEGIYFYTHYSGYRLNDALSAALDFGRSRWDDEAYLTRILASQIFKELHDDTLGGGISLSRTGGDGYPIIVVDIANQRLYALPEGAEQGEPDETTVFESFYSYVMREHPEREPYENVPITKM